MENGRAAPAVLPACLDEGEMTLEPDRTWGSAVGRETASRDSAAYGAAGCTSTASDLLGRGAFALETQGRIAAVASQSVQFRR